MLAAAAPTLAILIHLPNSSEKFSELSLLGPNHKAEDYPFNIASNNNYSLFLGVGNHLGYCAYYLVEVKFRNQTQPAPNSFNRTSSSLPSLFNITAFVADEGTWELPLTFSFDFGYNETLTQVNLFSMTLNDVSFDMRNYTIVWDSRNNGFLGSLFFELWVYDTATSSFRYHERFVGLWFNMTSS